MFKINQSSRQFPTKLELLPFVRDRGINKIKYPDGNTIADTCVELGQSLPKHEAGKMISPCDLKMLSDLLKFVFLSCEETRIYYQISGRSRISRWGWGVGPSHWGGAEPFGGADF